MSTGTENSNSMETQTKLPSLKSKIVRRILKSCLVLMLSVGFSIGFLITPWGTQALLHAADSWLDELTIDYNSGGMGSELHLLEVKWKQADSHVGIYNLRSSLQLSCLWRFALCVDSLSTDNILVKIKTTNSAPQKEPSERSFTLPFPVSIENINLSKVSLKVDETVDVSWQKLTGKLDFFQRLRIEKMQIDGVNLTSYSAKEASSSNQQSFDWTSWQYQPITNSPLVLPIHFDVLALNISNAQIQLSGQNLLKLKRVNLKARGDKKKVQVQELRIEHEQGRLFAEGDVQLNGQFEHVFSVDVNAVIVDQAPLKLTFRSSGNIDSLSTQVELTETVLTTKTPVDTSQSRALKAVLDLTAELSKARLPVKMTLDWSHLKWPLAEPEFQSDAGLFEVEGDLNTFKLTAQTMLAGKNVPDTKIYFNATGISSAQDKRFELDKFLLETLGGQILSQGVLTFSKFINWQGNSTISQIDPSIFWPELAAKINGNISTEANNNQGVWQAKLNELDINGQWQGYPLHASGNIDFHQKDGLQLQAVSFKNADNTLTLQGGISKQQALDIKFRLAANDLSSSLPQLGGALHFTGDFSGSTEQPEISYALSGHDLMVSDVFVQNAVGKGNIKWDQQKPVALELELIGIQGISNQIDSAKVTLNGDASDHHFDLTTSGLNTSVNLSIQGQLNPTSWQGNWLSGDVVSSYANLSLDEPFKIEADWDKQQYQITPHCWRHVNNELCIKLAEFKQNTLAWDVSLKDFDLLSVVRRLMPHIPKIQTKSRLNLDMSGDWNIEQMPNATLSARLSPADWHFNEQNNLQLTLNETIVKAHISQKNIQANINLSGNKIGKLSANVEGHPGVYAEPLNRPIQGDLLIERFDLSAFKMLLPQLDVLQGKINGQSQIDGTLGKPLFTGELALANGALKDETLPVALSAIEQKISLKGQTADFAGSYKLGEGQGKMSGDIAWIPALKGNLHITGENLEFDYQSMIKARVSPNISLMFEPDNLAVNGEVVIPYARVKVRELSKGSISPSKDIILVEKQAQQKMSKQRLALNVLLNIDPLLSNEVKLDAFGLTTDLQGQLRLQNNKSEIFGNGEVELVNGRYRAYGQNLLIREGDILFNSSLDRPYLNIEAVRDPDLTADDVVAGLRVTGIAESPNVSVFSEPVMEQQQTLSYILTGRGLGESGGDSQDTILTNALLSLGLGQSENLVSKVGNKLGFQDVNLDTSGQGDDTQLSLTGTIAPGVQLRYGVGVFDSISEIAIRYELMPKLYIEAVSGGGVRNAIDIYYQFSIEGSQNKQVIDD